MSKTIAKCLLNGIVRGRDLKITEENRIIRGPITLCETRGANKVIVYLSRSAERSTQDDNQDWGQISQSCFKITLARGCPIQNDDGSIKLSNNVVVLPEDDNLSTININAPEELHEED